MKLNYSYKHRLIISIQSAIIAVVATFSVNTAMAKPRTMSQMRQAATTALNAAGKAFAPSKSNGKTLKVVESRRNLMLLGYEDGAYAVVTTDDSMPEVVGISSTPYSNGRNKNFEWWLKTMDKTIERAVANNERLNVTTPAPQQYPSEVQPLMTTKWDQLAPYNNYLPEGIYTGCVATAMAQVLNYCKSPVHGYGEKTVTINTSVYTNEKLTANFAEDYYDWGNMLDTYADNLYTTEQANAVALLMRDCGVAADMAYGGDKEGGSGAFLNDAAEGLRKHFGFQDAEYLDRYAFSEKAWMNRIYAQISSYGPIVYSGVDESKMAGHAFVLHGYRSDGKVYVNWGWSGDDDGWYDVATLKMADYSFEGYQDMIVGLKPLQNAQQEISVTTNEAGSLSSLLPDNAIESVVGITVGGKINSTDIKTLRTLAGSDENMKRTKGVLQMIDLSNAIIVSGGEAYLIDGGNGLTTTDNQLPERAFYGCEALRKLKLPTTLTAVGNGAFAYTDNLEEVEFTNLEEAFFAVDDNFLYSDREKTTIANIMPAAAKKLEIAESVTTIDDYSLAGSKAKSLLLPSSLTEIGRFALYKCSDLREIRVAATHVPAVGSNGFDGIDFVNCKLYVPKGTKEDYQEAYGWRNFKSGNSMVQFDNIIEYDVDDTPSAIMEVTSNNDSNSVYDLLGRRIATQATPSSLQNLPAGIYIVGGKKFVIR